MNKSKFLKKSLAMLLALMLVVAMIPLSASAAVPNLSIIFIDGNPVEAQDGVFSADIGTKHNDPDVTLSLGQELKDASLYLKKANSDVDRVEITTTTGNTQRLLADYGVEEDDVVTMDLVLENDKDKTDYKTFTVELTRKASNTTTTLEKVEPVVGTGVYSVTKNDAAHTVDVVLAYGATAPKINVTAAEKATISGKTTETISVSDGAKFTVVSESTGNKAEYIIKVSYENALTSFTIAGVEAVIEDKDNNNNGKHDTVTVTLPKSAVLNEYNEAIKNPKLPVTFVTNGDTATVTLTGISDRTTTDITGIDPQTVKSGDSAFFGKLTDNTDGSLDEITSNNGLTVTCAGVTQTYDLVIKFQQDNATAITYARLDDQIGTVEGKLVTAELPADASFADVEVVLRTATTVDSITVNDGTGSVKNFTKGSIVDGDREWTYSTVDLRKNAILTVTAENGEIANYTLSATKASNVTTASLTSVYLVNGDDKYLGNINGHTITFNNIPYMTTDIKDWKVYATPIAGSNATAAANGAAVTTTVIANGTTKAADLWKNGSGNVPLSAQGNKGTTNVGQIAAVNKTNSNVVTVYDVVVNLATAKTGNTLNSLEITAQSQVNNTSDKIVYRAISDANTVKGDVNETDAYNGTIDLEVPFSLFDTGTDYRYTVTDFAADNGGVVFGIQYDDTVASGTGKYFVFPLKATVNDIETKTITGSHIDPQYTENNSSGTDGNTFKRVIVLTEEIARKVLTDGYSNGGSFYLPESDAKKGVIYTVNATQNDPSHDAVLSTFSVGDFDFTVNNSTYTISGTIPWTYTYAGGTTTPDAGVAAGAAAAGKAFFADFEISPYAVLSNTLTVGGEAFFAPNGDTNGDGEVDDGSAKNLRFVFVRDTNNKVKVYRYLSTTGGLEGAGEITSVTVKAEDRLTTGDVTEHEYKFDLTYADANTEADITSFKIGNYNGTVDNTDSEDRTIRVVMPYGTDLKGLIPTFTTSPYATVAIAAPNGTPLLSGKTSVNFSHPVELYVTSEDGLETIKYTVTVTADLQFSDVNEDDWFYNNVMGAVENGYMSGMGDGTFGPMKTATRAQFASALACAMGYEAPEDPTTIDTPFVDVDADDWYAGAVAFCKENGIISGYEDTTFRPDQTITRQEAAAMLNNAFGLEASTDVSKFTDAGKIASWATAHVAAVANAELMNGDAAGTFRPTGTLTRAELASILMNANIHGFID